MKKMLCDDSSLIDSLIGQSILVRSATVYNLGRLVAVDESFLQLQEASWVADTGRWNEALRDGTLSEVEPHTPDTVLVSRGGIIDIVEWAHPLPTEAK